MNTTVTLIEKSADEIAGLILKGNYAEAKSRAQAKDESKGELVNMSYLLALSQVKKKDFQRYTDYARNMFGNNVFSSPMSMQVQ